MPREFFRSDRVADAIQRSLATVIQTQVRDPRLGLINVNSVDVTRDLSTAKVYVTLVGAEEDDESKQAVKILNNAAGFLRNVIAKELTMRSVPRLSFFYDKTAVDGQKLSNLIDKAVSKDREVSNNDESSGSVGSNKEQGE